MNIPNIRSLDPGTCREMRNFLELCWNVGNITDWFFTLLGSTSQRILKFKFGFGCCFVVRSCSRDT